MGDPVKDAWNEVAEGFSKLGQAMKERYQGAEHEPGPEASSGAAEDGLREAFERFVTAGRDVGQRTVETVRDADVNAQAKHAAVSLNDALSATVDMIGREVAGFFGSRHDERSDAVTDEPVVVGIPPEDAGSARASTTGLVTGPVEEPPDVEVADIETGDGPTI